jgi:alkylation response protein AidB-like acyl-CoA dehydrogenase
LDQGIHDRGYDCRYCQSSDTYTVSRPNRAKRRPVFTDDQLAIRDLTRRFVRTDILPNILQWDQDEAVPAHVWRRIGELGLHGDCAIANQIGGISFPYVAKLLQFGTEKQKEEFLRPGRSTNRQSLSEYG